VTFPGLCAWVINIIKFYEVYCDVEPKRQALYQANAELAAAQEKLSVIKRKVSVSVLCLIASAFVKKKKKLRGLSPRANYTDRASAFVFCNKQIHWALQ